MYIRFGLAAVVLSLTSPTAFADCTADVAAVIASFNTHGPYRLDWTSQMDGETSTDSGEVVAVDRMRTGFYIRTPAGYFAGGSKVEDQGGSVIFSTLSSLVKVGQAGINNPVCQGVMSFEDSDVTAYQFETEAALMGMMGKATVALYIGADGKPA
jgi:hypothetical protein